MFYETFFLFQDPNFAHFYSLKNPAKLKVLKSIKLLPLLLLSRRRKKGLELS